MYGTHHVAGGDLFNISARLKEIDKGYFVVYSYKKKRFEVHNRLQRGGSFCLAVPYDRLDARTVELVRKTRAERTEQLLAEAEKHNAALYKQALYDARRGAEAQMEKLLV